MMIDGFFVLTHHLYRAHGLLVHEIGMEAFTSELVTHNLSFEIKSGSRGGGGDDVAYWLFVRYL